VEIAVAQLSALYLSAHQAKGATPVKVSDFLPYLNPWPVTVKKQRYSETDLSILTALGAKTE